MKSYKLMWLAILLMNFSNLYAATLGNVKLAGLESVNFVLQKWDARRINIEKGSPMPQALGDVVPVDVSFLISEGKKITSIAGDFESYSNDAVKIEVKSLSVRASAESNPEDHRPYIDGKIKLEISTGNVSAVNRFDISVADQIFSGINFIPGVTRAGEVDLIDSWLYDIKLSNDGELKMSFFTKDFSKINPLLSNLFNGSPEFPARISSVRRTDLEGHKLFLCEVNNNQNQTSFQGKINFLYDYVYAIVSSSGASFQEMHFAPTNMRNSFELPMKLRLANIPAGQAEQIKSAILEIGFDGIGVKSDAEDLGNEEKLEIDFFVYDSRK